MSTIKVRVVVIEDSRGNYESFSATQKTIAFHDTGWPAAYKNLPGHVLISDTIIEIEDKRGIE